MKALEKHSKQVEWLAETETEEARQACFEYIRTVRKSRMDWDDKSRLRDALVSKRSEARLTLIIGGAA